MLLTTVCRNSRRSVVKDVRHHGRRRGHQLPQLRLTTTMRCIGVLVQAGARAHPCCVVVMVLRVSECVRACAHSLILSRTLAGQIPTTGGGKRVLARTILITASVLITPLSTFRLFNTARSCPFGRLRTRVSANRRRRRRRRRVLRFWPFVSAVRNRGYF